ncbi:MAG: hypothetical protein HY927_09835 [Elusimicrobia bacterium]|nr:hypothetical protein [Elusimicrobiota bacterium]
MLSAALLALARGPGAAGEAALSARGGFETEDASVELRSPHGYGLRARFVRPRFAKYPGRRFAAVLRLPGGWGAGTGLLDHRLAGAAAARGVVVAAFDAEPKLREEIGSPVLDYNGAKDQDDAAVVLRELFRHPGVDPAAVGVWSHSNGVTIAAGVLAREEFRRRVLFLLDDEGPHAPWDIIRDERIELRDPGLRRVWREKVLRAKVPSEYRTPEEFFRERSAVDFIGKFEGIYQRVQGREDHVLLSWHGHAAAMIRAAAPPAGKARWTRLNRSPRDRVYRTPGDLEAALDIERVRGPNDRRLWDRLLRLFDEGRAPGK